MTKQCTKCKKQKPFSDFSRRKASKGGFSSRCKNCIKRYRQTFTGYLSGRFQTIRQRCNNPKNPKYKDYGGRGIQCLFKSRSEFADYVVNELQVNPRNLQIDRIDNDGHYEKGNIRFVTSKVNNNNRRNSKNDQPESPPVTTPTIGMGL